MTKIDETVYKELEELFDNLKRSCQKIADDAANNESGDKLQETTGTTQEKLANLSTRLDEILQTLSVAENGPDYPKIIAMKASLLYEKAKILLSTEENEECKNKLDEAIAMIDKMKENPHITYLYLRCINHLAYVYSKLGNFDKSKEILENITKYEIKDDILVYSTEELFSTNEYNADKSQASSKLHKLAINNLQMLSWVYIKQGLDLESAKVQHEILQLELTYGESDPIDWATRCARIAVLHLSKMRWISARYYLSAAGSVLDRLERDMIDHPDLAKAEAELARGWIYYALKLFEASKAKDIDRICNEIFKDEQSTSDHESDEQINVEDDDSASSDTSPCLFIGQDVKTEEVPATFIKNLDQAKALFYYTNTWLKRARLYYTLRDHPFMYVSCVLDLSELYRYLAFYETDTDAQYNVQKRRADALETLSGILKEVRPQCYIAVSVELLRELAEVQIELMGLNLRRIYKMQEPTEGYDAIKRRMDAVNTIQAKLEKFGNMLGHGHDLESPSREDIDERREEEADGDLVEEKS
ncbi:KIF-binding protein-like [Onthophagus taurus]|uniref:KIF-binding protein-like n=1 Tax=Onthophagus taurus TaxID=166361 RepID=UPI000C20E1E7|nr:protein KBP homolog [Onthophagus taurus]